MKRLQIQQRREAHQGDTVTITLTRDQALHIARALTDAATQTDRDAYAAEAEVQRYNLTAESMKAAGARVLRGLSRRSRFASHAIRGMAEDLRRSKVTLDAWEVI